jgi:NAD(P)-dependent dehydrogenase (short-subunit alcohol dehydrogenase family)
VTFHYLLIATVRPFHCQVIEFMAMPSFTGLWGLVNNAGVNFLGDIELTTVDQFSYVMGINQLGMVRVTKAFLPAIRRRKGWTEYYTFLIFCQSVNQTENLAKSD